MTSTGGQPEASASSPGRAVAALALLVPAPTVGTLAGLAFEGGAGVAVWAAMKVWLLVVPAAWYLGVDRGVASWSPPRRGGFGVAALAGLGMGAAVVATYGILAPDIDTAHLREEVAGTGLRDPRIYLGACLYWIFVNSVLEEYVYRWFVFRKCEALLPPRAAVAAAALLFTVHHVVGLSISMGPGLAALAGVGIAIGGATLSTLYLRYRSVWPAWIAHALVDVAVFGAGWHLLFVSAG